MIDHRFLGRAYAATPPYEISRAKIAEFADALGDRNPFYRDPDAARAAGYPDVIAPPTMAVVVSLSAQEQPLFDPEIDVDFSRVVHGDQRYVHHRPMHAGDLLHAVVVIETIRGIGVNQVVGTRCEVSDARNGPVFTAYASMVIRGDQ